MMASDNDVVLLDPSNNFINKFSLETCAIEIIPIGDYSILMQPVSIDTAINSIRNFEWLCSNKSKTKTLVSSRVFHQISGIHLPTSHMELTKTMKKERDDTSQNEGEVHYTEKEIYQLIERKPKIENLLHDIGCECPDTATEQHEKAGLISNDVIEDNEYNPGCGNTGKHQIQVESTTPELPPDNQSSDCECVEEINAVENYIENCPKNDDDVLPKDRTSPRKCEIHEKNSGTGIENCPGDDNDELNLASQEKVLQNDSSSLSKHSMDKNGYHVCECGKKYKTEMRLKKHKETDIHLFTCKYCEKPFKNNEKLAIHVKTHEMPFKCLECDRTYAKKRYLKRHLSLAHPEKDNPFKCPECGECFKKHNAYDRHMATEHNQAFECTNCMSKFVYQASYKSHIARCGRPDGKFVCECGKKYRTEEGLKQHKETDTHQYICAYCGKVFNRSQAHAEHLRNHTKAHKCPLCPKEFRTPSLLQKHQHVHTGRGEYICDVCGKALATKEGLDAHVISAHTDNRQFKCQMCPKSFKFKVQLTNHVRIHTNERPHKCQFCMKGFAERNTLKQHERIHTGEKPYKCQLCEQAFNQRNGLRSHMASTHGIQAAKTKPSQS